MMKKLLLGIILLLLPALHAGTLQCSFDYTNVIPSTNYRWISTSLQFTPQLSSSTSAVCTGSDFSPSMQLSSLWFPSSGSYDARLDSHATGAGCLVSAGSQSKDRPIIWIDSGKFQQLVNRDSQPGIGRQGSYFSDMAEFTQFMSQAGITFTESQELSKYADTNTVGANFQSGSNTLFKSGVAVYCKGTLRLVSTTPMPDGSTYSQVIASDYTGTMPSSYTKPKSSTPGSATFALKLDVTGCRAFGRTYMNPSTCPASPDSVWIYGTCPASSNTQTGNEVTVQFENPFTCSMAISGVSPNPATVAQGGSFALNFNIANNAARPISVTAISLSAESQQYFDAAGTSFTLPAGDIAANGGIGAVSGTIKSKPGTVAGTYPLKLDISSHSTQADCGNSNNVQCSAPATLIVNVNVVPGQACSLAFSPAVPGNNIQQGASAPIVAACSPSPCPALTWTHTASSATTLSPPSTPSQASPQSTLAVAANEPLGSYVASASGGSLSCTPLNFNVVAPSLQQTCVISFVNNVPGNNLMPGQSAQLKATCANPSTCPSLTWSHTASSATTTVPNPTTAQNPQTTLAIAATEPVGSYSASASNGALACTSQQFNVVSLSTLPNYVVQYISPAGFHFVGEQFDSNVTTQNIGADATASSVTSASFLGQVGQIPVPPLPSQANYTRQVLFTCLSSGTSTENAIADATSQITESNEGDNSLGIPVFCSPKPVSCSCGIVNHNLNLTENESVIVNATCYDASHNIVLCPALNWSHNATGSTVNLNPTATSRNMTPETNLSVGAGAVAQLNIAVKAVSAEPLIPLQCTPAQFNIITEPGAIYNITSCNFSGVNPSGSRLPAFFAGQSSTLLAACTRNGNPGCPALRFAVTLAGASMAPTGTTGTSSPQNSLLTLPLSEPSSIIGANVTVSCSNPAQCTASINCPFVFSPSPTNMTCGFVGHTAIFTANDSAIVEANCTKNGSSNPAACPELDWETNITNAQFNPAHTSQMQRPTTNFSTTNAPVPQSGYINARGSASSGFGSLQCDRPLLPSVQNVGPDYEVTWVKSPGYMIEPGAQFTVRVNVTNVGNRNVTVDTLTSLLAANCGIDQFRATSPLQAGQSVIINDFKCTCASEGTFNITAVADSGHGITGELNFANNRKSGTYICGNRYAPTCSDYV